MKLIRDSHPLLFRLFFIVVLPVVLLSGCVLAYLSRSLPQDSGNVVVQGVENNVSLTRDALGVAHIEGKSDEDVFFALGYAHAQDRLWQLEVQKRTAQGRLSEIFGQESIDNDIWFRTLGLYQGAAQSWDSLSTEAQASLVAYAKGINAYLEKSPVLPPEFLLFDIKPQHWHVHDSLAWMKIFALSLSGSFSQEITRLLASQALTEKQLGDLFDTYPKEGPVTTGPGEAAIAPAIKVAADSQRDGLMQILRLQAGIESGLKVGGPYVGSNAWVVGPRHTRNGQAILANDPHLGLQLPSLWYQARLRGRKIDSAGMTLVGLPLVILGANQQIAWGATAMMADNQDLYFEQVKPDDQFMYRAGDQWLPFTARTETIKVRPAFPSSLRKPLKPVTIAVRTTRHGPVISDMFKVFAQPVTLQWTGLSGRDTTYEGFFKLNYASDWDSFKTALSYQVAPNMNMFYSDRAGNIGYLGIGHIPLRKKGRGAYPVPGWDDGFGWSGVVPADAMPVSFNPSEGYIVNANNRVTGDDYPFFISQDWAPPSRALRIRQLLDRRIGSGAGLTMADMQQMQADTLSLPAAKMLPYLLRLQPKDERQRDALALLRSWNGDMRRDSQAAALFNVWMGFLRHALFDDELGTHWGKTAEAGFLRGLSDRVPVSTLYRALTDVPNVWCNDVTTDAAETCDERLSTSLTDAIDQLSKFNGRDMDSWKWGDVQRITYGHQPFSQVKVLDTLFGRKVSSGGSPDSINVAYSSFSPSEGYVQKYGAAFRQIIGMQAQGKTQWTMNSTGQSGNVFSAHYDDMVTSFGNVAFPAMDEDSSSWKRLTLQAEAPSQQGRR